MYLGGHGRYRNFSSGSLEKFLRSRWRSRYLKDQLCILIQFRISDQFCQCMSGPGQPESYEATPLTPPGVRATGFA